MAASSNMAEQAEAAQISYEDLARLEEEFDDVDVQILRQQYALSAPLYAKRAAAIARIPNFWPLVLEQAPLEIDQYIQPQDSRIFAESLVNIEVRRPELDDDKGATGNPRSVSVRMEFRENGDFEDTVLEKHFWHRRAKDGWVGLVSEPVKIRWKEGKDLTNGLTDGAVALFEARKDKGDMTDTDVPEYHALKQKVESWNGQNTSFFTWFGWVSGRRYVTAEESDAANAAKATRDGAAEPPTEAEIEAADDHDEDVEVHQAGEELAVAVAEELWPNAIKLFTEAQEEGEMSDAEFEEDEESEEEGEDGMVDLRELVGKGGGGEEGKGSRVVSGASGEGRPPSKKQKR